MTEGRTSLVKCHVCRGELEREDVIEEESKILCEDCYIESHHKIQACDPWAVRSKKIFRAEAGFEGTEGLTELQKAIYDCLEWRGKKGRNCTKIFDIFTRNRKPICSSETL